MKTFFTELCRALAETFSGCGFGNGDYQVRVLKLLDDLDVVQLNVEILVYAFQRAAQLDVVF